MVFTLFYEYSCQFILVQIASTGLVLEVASVWISSCIQCSVTSTVVIVNTPLVTVCIVCLVRNHNMNIVTKQTIFVLVLDVLELCNTRYESIRCLRHCIQRDYYSVNLLS